MESVQKEGFKIIGIKIRTTNKDMQAAKDIPALWQKFMSENISEKIPNKIDQSIMAIYTNYEGDHTQPYDTIIGCKVSNLNDIPKGMISQEFNTGKYSKFTSKGNLEKGAVYNTWVGEKAQNPENGEVEIFVAVQ